MSPRIPKTNGITSVTTVKSAFLSREVFQSRLTAQGARIANANGFIIRNGLREKLKLGGNEVLLSSPKTISNFLFDHEIDPNLYADALVTISAYTKSLANCVAGIELAKLGRANIETAISQKLIKNHDIGLFAAKEPEQRLVIMAQLGLFDFLPDRSVAELSLTRTINWATGASTEQNSQPAPDDPRKLQEMGVWSSIPLEVRVDLLEKNPPTTQPQTLPQLKDVEPRQQDHEEIRPAYERSKPKIAMGRTLIANFGLREKLNFGGEPYNFLSEEEEIVFLFRNGIHPKSFAEALHLIGNKATALKNCISAIKLRKLSQDNIEQALKEGLIHDDDTTENLELFGHDITPQRKLNVLQALGVLVVKKGHSLPIIGRNGQTDLFD